ncbi:MAG: hypothetical protein ACFE0I_15615 [Elainellaceae cyanobacterium]
MRFGTHLVQNTVQKINPKSMAALAIATVGSLITACGENRAVECNRLIEVANRAVDQVQQITQTTGPEDTRAHLQVAEVVDQAAGDLQEIQLSDQQLQRYKQQFITMYTSTSKATRELVQAVDVQDSVPVREQANAAEDAYRELRDATSQEGELVSSVNTYCSADSP